MIKLVISDNEGTTTVVPLVRDEISIGRQEGNTIRLTERNVSRRHARLMAQGDGYVIEDLGSYNGTRVNGHEAEGTLELQSGDQIVIGDYRIRVHADAYGIGPHRPGFSMAPPASTPARVVMLNDPAPGAEFSLSDQDTVRLGRSEELDVPINHRSVSREHAAIRCEREQYVVNDLGSANGVIVNGSRVQRQALVPGDVIELGQVAFRFVGPGERYLYDPEEAMRYVRQPGVHNKENTRLAAVLLGSAVIIALVVLFTGNSDDSSSAELQDVYPAEQQQVQAGEPGVEPSASGYERALADCQEALEAEHFAEAAAHARLALQFSPQDTDANACQEEAERLQADEQTYVRGQAILLNNEVEAAYRVFAELSEGSPFFARPEVREAIDKLATKRLEDAAQQLTTDPEGARKIAEDVQSMVELSEQHRAAAVALMEAAGNAGKAGKPGTSRGGARASEEAAQPEVGTGDGGSQAPSRGHGPGSRHDDEGRATDTPSPGRGAEAPQEADPSRTPEVERAAPVLAGTRPRPTPVRPERPVVEPGTPEPAPRTPSPRRTVPTISPLEQANACLARGDNACAVDALEGRAGTPRELALLVETYRTMGNTRAALRHMALYVKQYPDAARARVYRDQLAEAKR